MEVDLALSAHANARAYYDSRRKHQARPAAGGADADAPWLAVRLQAVLPHRPRLECVRSVVISRTAVPAPGRELRWARRASCLQVKQQKTLDANQKALKAAEKKAQAQLKQVCLLEGAPDPPAC